METSATETAQTTKKAELECPKAEPQKEHEWLQRIVGEWTCEGEATMGADQPPVKWKATETVRSIGGLWVVGEGSGEDPTGGKTTTIITLGFDPQKGKFIGTFIGSMMTNMWVYEGSLNADETELTLDCEGPSMAGDGKMAKYHDIVTLKDNNTRLLTSRIQGPDGKWQQIMTATYKRVK